MNNDRTYLDYNAGAPLLAGARRAMQDALAASGNASSVHREGRNARKLVENARDVLAATIGAKPGQIIFTSGASEAANQALSPIVRASGREISVSRLYVSASEHPCVLSGGRFSKDQIEIVPIHESGLLDLVALEAKLAAHDVSTGAAMVAVMLANNETGVIQPINEISRIVADHDAFLMVDAVQVLGKIPFDIRQLGAHFIILSSHKIGGPQGAGALVLGNAAISPLSLIVGGGQENFHRGGTENVAAIAGFGAAIVEMTDKIRQSDKIAAMRDLIEHGISTICIDAGNKAGEPVYFGLDAPRLDNTSCFAIPGIKAETALISMDLAGIAISSGSACSSGKVKKSHVLAAMGVSDDLADCALRISAGCDTNKKDADKFLGELKNIVNRIG